MQLSIPRRDSTGAESTPADCGCQVRRRYSVVAFSSGKHWNSLDNTHVSDATFVTKDHLVMNEARSPPSLLQRVSCTEESACRSTCNGYATECKFSALRSPYGSPVWSGRNSPSSPLTWKAFPFPRVLVRLLGPCTHPARARRHRLPSLNNPMATTERMRSLAECDLAVFDESMG